MDHTEDHFRAAIQEVGRCLFTPVEGIVVLPGEIVLTHPDCRDTLQGH
ncbi:prepilin, shufflon protein A [Escherichia coli]|nr:prepilin, shufflon protein A [Escherichia coli]OAT65034.1 prepilin, shufflon protein A [Escherichia coli]OCW53095.1 prepilin, shufflon protein A [Escherichia coli]